MTSPSSSAELRPSCRTACSIDEKRFVQSSPVRVNSLIPSPSTRACSRYPSNLTSWAQCEPLGGRSAREARQGSTKRGGPRADIFRVSWPRRRDWRFRSQIGTATGLSDGLAAEPARRRRSPEHDLRVFIGCEVNVDRVGSHVLAATRSVEKATHGEQAVLRAARHQGERGPSAKDDSVMGAA